MSSFARSRGDPVIVPAAQPRQLDRHQVVRQLPFSRDAPQDVRRGPRRFIPRDRFRDRRLDPLDLALQEGDVRLELIRTASWPARRRQTQEVTRVPRRGQRCRVDSDGPAGNAFPVQLV
jgi:hypothetical protein